MSTTATTRMHRGGFALIAAVLFALTLSGCGPYYHDDYYGGVLEVRNDPASIEAIDYVHLWVPGGPIESFAMFLLPGEIDTIDLYPDTYTVQFEWSDAVLDTYPGIDIYDDSVTVLVGSN